LLIAGWGCSCPHGLGTSSEPPVVSQKHPLADRVDGKLFLRDGRVVSGTIHWRESRQEYTVWFRHPPYHLSYSADRVERIEVRGEAEQTESTVQPKAAPNAASAVP
jgi:hypothetical protein